MSKHKTYFIKTYGCQMNVADSEKVAGWYESKGWKSANKIKEADEIVIVSCSVRESAENRVFGLVNNLIKLKTKNLPAGRQGKKLKIILTGCMLRYSQRWLKEKLPDVDEFKKINEYKVQSSKNIVRQSEKHAYIPIMEGCNNFCSYCVVPYARGREVSRSFEEIVCEVEELANRGYKEITLLGQNVNSYGKDINNFKFEILNFKSISKVPNFKTKYETPFAILLETLHQIPEIEKISFLTSNPWDLNEEIIEAMSLSKIDRYLHLPVQSGDNEILKKMNRKYTVSDYLKLVEKIRNKIPEIKIGTDIIVGFPGETEEQFQNTVDLCKKVGFTKAYVSIYSPREQTAAYKMKEEIPFKEKRRRWTILNQLVNNAR